jgi:hypothetical protein
MPFPIDKQYITAAEQVLNLTFPTSFKNKMMIENGGELFLAEDDWQLFPFFDESDQKRKCVHATILFMEPNLQEHGMASLNKQLLSLTMAAVII